jgi:Rod binding domain-containing protein
MNLDPITSSPDAKLLAHQAGFPVAHGPKPAVPERDPAELARQFEGILVRQMLAESMKGIIEGPKGQQTYGYFISEALSDGITKGGGFGLRSVLELQLRGQDDARRAADRHKQGFVEGPQTSGGHAKGLEAHK